MPKRPVAHINEDLARALLVQTFARAGWAINDLHSDYGEDMLVRIFKEERATPFSFFVQSKSVRNISKRMASKGRSISQTISTEHLLSWSTFREPVILAVSDIESQVTYWECLQMNMGCREAARNAGHGKASISVTVPLDNILDESGLMKIEAITKSLYNTANRERAALAVLTRCLNLAYGLTAQCDSQIGLVVLPAGTFTPDTKGDLLIFPFGGQGKDMVELLGKDDTRWTTFMNEGIVRRKAFEAVLQSEKCIPLLDPKTGKVMRTIASMEEYDRAMAELIEKHMHEKTR